MSRRRWTLVSLPFVLAWAGYAYVHDGYHTFDAAAQTYPFDDEKGTNPDLPAAVRELDGRRVTVDGYMIPIDQADPVRRFAVVPELRGGGWNPPYPLQQVVVTDGASAHAYAPDRIRVAGRLRVGVVKEDGYIVALYTLHVDYIESTGNVPLSPGPPTVAGGLVVLVAATFAGRRLRRRGRTSAGRCLGCGYDLRMTPARCPECGRAAVAGTI